MSKFERLSPLGGNSGKFYESENVSLKEEPYLHMAKINAHNFQATDESAFLTALGISGALQPNRVLQSATTAVAWMSPRERLILGEETAVEEAVKLAKECVSTTKLVIALSDARCSIRVEGVHSRRVLASITPLDYHPSSFAVDDCARTLFGETGVFIQRLTGDNEFRLIVDQSYSVYVWRMLEDACRNVSIAA